MGFKKGTLLLLDLSAHHSSHHLMGEGLHFAMVDEMFDEESFSWANVEVITKAGFRNMIHCNFTSRERSELPYAATIIRIF